MESDTPKGKKVPVSYQAVVWICMAALRREPKAGLDIEDVLRKGEQLNIVAEQDGFCQLDNSLWIFQLAIQKT
jgi:hypothetical protein